MAQTAIDCAVSGAEVGHRVPTNGVSRIGAYLMPLEAVHCAFEDA